MTTYVIRKTGKGRWTLFLDTSGRLLMERLATYKSKQQAITTARLLAGRCRDIVVEN